MTPELRAAAEWFLNASPRPSGMTQQYGELLARHVLAEREDDGERLTPEWMAQQLGRKQEYSGTVWVNGAVNIVADIAWCAGEQLCSMEYRFQFRRLCELLGVTLKEPQ